VITVRLVVRRVRPTPGSQLALFTHWDYHAMVTDRDGDLLQVEADHRRHAVVEQSIAELKSAGRAHLPSGRFMANRRVARLSRGKCRWVVRRCIKPASGSMQAGGDRAVHIVQRATRSGLSRLVISNVGGSWWRISDCWARALIAAKFTTEGRVSCLITR
jgi:hypothetical protein